MMNNLKYPYLFSVILPLGLVSTLFIVSQMDQSHISRFLTSNTKPNDFTGLHLHHEAKQKGAHIFGINKNTDFTIFQKHNLEWITMVPWGYQKDIDSPNVSHHNGDSTYIKKNNQQWIEKIKLVHDSGFKVFIKPHLWITNPTEGKWRSDIYPSSDEDWLIWKESYRDFILRYALIAEQAQAEMFCIGVEFYKLTSEKPEYWSNLIEEIRKIYSGRIVYAANWYKEYEQILFWDSLDYVGIQAYFPLTNVNNPNKDQISEGWKKHMIKLQQISKHSNRKVLFTEMGYKSTANSATKPWEWYEHIPSEFNIYSEETQSNCYKAFFETVWKKDWFAGVHIWQMRSDHHSYDRKNFLYDFTPQGKKAEIVISKGFL